MLRSAHQPDDAAARNVRRRRVSPTGLEAIAAALVAVRQGGYVYEDWRRRMTDIRRTALLSHPLPAAPDRVEAYRVELPPGQPTGRHFHPGPVTGYVERGLIAFGRDGEPAGQLGPGDVFFEPAGETIYRFDNLSATEPAVFIAFYLLTGDQALIQPIP
jgi:quercetin dioxygenase-like cupin family protein